MHILSFLAASIVALLALFPMQAAADIYVSLSESPYGGAPVESIEWYQSGESTWQTLALSEFEGAMYGHDVRSMASGDLHVRVNGDDAAITRFSLPDAGSFSWSYFGPSDSYPMFTYADGSAVDLTAYPGASSPLVPAPSTLLMVLAGVPCLLLRRPSSLPLS